MAAQSTSTGATRQRRQLFNAQEVLEYLTTIESDVGEVYDSSDNDFEPSEAENSDNDDEMQVNIAPVADDDSRNEVGPDTVQQIDEGEEEEEKESQRGGDDGFIDALLEPWNQNFNFFPVVPDFYGQEESGLHCEHKQQYKLICAHQYKHTTV